MEIIPAILEQNIEAIQQKLDQLTNAGNIALVQLDITDGTLTGQSSWANPLELEQLKWAGEFELHLMQDQPSVIDWLKDSRVMRCIVHAEASYPNQLLQQIRALGRRAGLALNPQTQPRDIVTLAKLADYFVLLTVVPGAQGQDFQEQVLMKVGELASLVGNKPIYIDGGINDLTTCQVKNHNVAGVAVGSFLWNSQDLGEAMESLQ